MTDGTALAPPPPGQEVRFIFHAGPLAIRAALCGLMGLLSAFRLSQEVRSGIEIAVAEVLNNICTHAYRGSAGRIEIRIRTEATRIAFVILDEGSDMPGGCPPLPPLPHRWGPEDDLPEGHFGWILIRAFCRSVAYRRVGLQNRLSFEFPLDVCLGENATNSP